MSKKEYLHNRYSLDDPGRRHTKKQMDPATNNQHGAIRRPTQRIISTLSEGPQQLETFFAKRYSGTSIGPKSSAVQPKHSAGSLNDLKIATSSSTVEIKPKEIERYNNLQKLKIGPLVTGRTSIMNTGTSNRVQENNESAQIGMEKMDFKRIQKAKQQDEERKTLVEQKTGNFKTWLAKEKTEDEIESFVKQLEIEEGNLKKVRKEKNKNDIHHNMWLKNRKTEDLEKQLAKASETLTSQVEAKRKQDNEKAYINWLDEAISKLKPIYFNEGGENLPTIRSVTSDNPISLVPNKESQTKLGPENLAEPKQNQRSGKLDKFESLSSFKFMSYFNPIYKEPNRESEKPAEPKRTEQNKNIYKELAVNSKIKLNPKSTNREFKSQTSVKASPYLSPVSRVPFKKSGKPAEPKLIQQKILKQYAVDSFLKLNPKFMNKEFKSQTSVKASPYLMPLSRITYRKSGKPAELKQTQQKIHKDYAANFEPKSNPKSINKEFKSLASVKPSPYLNAFPKIPNRKSGKPAEPKTQQKIHEADSKLKLNPKSINIGFKSKTSVKSSPYLLPLSKMPYRKSGNSAEPEQTQQSKQLKSNPKSMNTEFKSLTSFNNSKLYLNPFSKKANTESDTNLKLEKKVVVNPAVEAERKQESDRAYQKWLNQKKLEKLEKEIAHGRALIAAKEAKAKRAQESQKAYKEWMKGIKIRSTPIPDNEGFASIELKTESSPPDKSISHISPIQKATMRIENKLVELLAPEYYDLRTEWESSQRQKEEETVEACSKLPQKAKPMPMSAKTDFRSLTLLKSMDMIIE